MASRSTEIYKKPRINRSIGANYKQMHSITFRKNTFFSPKKETPFYKYRRFVRNWVILPHCLLHIYNVIPTIDVVYVFGIMTLDPQKWHSLRSSKKITTNIGIQPLGES